MPDLIKLTGDYGYDDFRIQRLKSTVIDASDAHWIVSNIGRDLNLYPVMVTDSADITLIGGTISGEVPMDMDWVDAYVNSAAVFVRNVPGVVIRDWTITQAWDGIRIRGADNFTIDSVWMSDIRDDSIENDDGLSGTVSNSLFDGVFVGMSTADSNTPDRSANVITFDNVLMRMESFVYKGVETHQSPFKVTGVSPQIKIYDTVFAIEDVDHIGQARLELAWDKVTDASGNYFLNLSDKPLSGNYPMPPNGFTLLEGKAARAYWEAAEWNWKSLNTEADTAVGATIVGGNANDALKGTTGNDIMLGGGGNDHLISFEGNDTLRGQNGDDILLGRTGVDILIGGRGQDTFRFAAAGESRPGLSDIIRGGDGAPAFEGAGIAGGDLFEVSKMDADGTIGGNQAFVFGSAKRGGISLIEVDGDTVVYGNTDGDAAFEFVVVIEDGAVLASDYTAADFLL